MQISIDDLSDTTIQKWSNDAYHTKNIIYPKKFINLIFNMLKGYSEVEVSMVERFKENPIKLIISVCPEELAPYHRLSGFKFTKKYLKETGNQI